MAGLRPVWMSGSVNYVAPSYKFTAANSKWVYRSHESDPSFSSATVVADQRCRANTFTLGWRFHPSLLWFSFMTDKENGKEGLVVFKELKWLQSYTIQLDLFMHLPPQIQFPPRSCRVEAPRSDFFSYEDLFDDRQPRRVRMIKKGAYIYLMLPTTANERLTRDVRSSELVVALNHLKTGKHVNDVIIIITWIPFHTRTLPLRNYHSCVRQSITPRYFFRFFKLENSAIMADGEQRRRSSRLLELDACKEKQGTSVQGPPADTPPPEDQAKRKRGRKKRRLDEVVLASVRFDNNINNHQQVQATEIAKREDDPPNTGMPLSIIEDANHQPLSASSATRMPEKRFLELVLDVLQRRDTYEIFAEPVKPEEVNGYYDIIKEPMDFGTMRAKLHEGMYASLEQFENDVFLISKNAMHFNAPSTIYFRQARAIEELASKVIHVLRTNPENLEVEFCLTKRKPGRRPRGEAGSLNIGSIRQLATNVNNSGTTTDITSINRPCSLYVPSSQTNPGSSMLARHVYKRNYHNLPGSRDGKRTNLCEVERRSTGKSWASYLSEDESTSSTVYNSSKPLVPVKQGYKESLMRFVSDLGPTAQKVANRKLQQCQVQASPNSQFPALNSQVPTTSTQRGSTPMNGLISAKNSSYFLDKLRKEMSASLGRDIVHQNPISETQLGSYHRTAGIGDLNFPGVGMTSSSSRHSTMMMDPSKSGSWIQPTELESQSRLPRFMPRNNDMVSSWPSQEIDGSSLSQAVTFEKRFFSHNSNEENQAMTGVGSVQGSTDPGCSQPKAKGVQGVLDLSYLQSRLNEMNSSNQCGLVQLQPELQLGMAPETMKPAFYASSSHQSPGHSHEAGPSNGRQSFSAQSFLERAQLHSHQVELGPKELSFNAFSFPETQQKELSAEELSFNALNFDERTQVQSYLAVLGADGQNLDPMSFDERALGGRRPSLSALPSSQERSFSMHTHQAELMNNPRELPFDAMNLHERATAHSLQTELMNSPRGLSFNAAASLQQRAPFRIHQGETSAPVLSNNEVSLHENAPWHRQQAEPNSGVLSFNTQSIHERTPLHGHRAERGSSWGLRFNEVGFHHELNPVAEGEGRPSFNAPASNHERPPSAVLALQAQVSSRGQSLNPLGFHEKPPVHEYQADPTTREILENQQQPLSDDKQPDLALQL